MNKLENKLEVVTQKRLQGRYKEAFELALQLADEAKSCQRPDIEIKAIWEAMDAGKVVYPEKRKLLQGLGRKSLGLMRLPRPDSIGARNDKEYRSLQAEARVRWGALLRALGKHGEAVKVLYQSLRDLDSGFRRNDGERMLPDPQMEAFALWNLGFALRMCLKLETAREKFLESKKIFGSLGDLSGRAYALCGLAGVTRLLGEPQKSLRLYKRAQGLFKKDRDPYGLAYTHCGMGNGLRKSGGFKEAILSYNKSQKLYKKLGDRVNEGYVLWGRAVCFRALGDFKKAFQDIRQANGYFRKGRDLRGLALVSNFLEQKSRKLARITLEEAKLS